MAKKFDIPKQSFSSVADAYNGLLGMDNNRVVNLPISQLDEIDNQPFPINESKVDQIADSIDAVGVLEPVIVARNGDRYSILSGRHRFRACQKLGKTEIPCFVKDYSADDPTARFILLATNTDRNNEYAPTVYARAYAEQLELLKQLGKKATVSAIAENNNMSRKQIYRYIRLNELITELQEWVDKGIITIEAAVELSFISEEKQRIIFEHINGLNIADNVITRHFKVATTKRIHTVAETLSDDEFSTNIEKILFSAYEGKPSAPTAQVGLEVPLTAKQDKDKTEIPIEQAERITEETSVTDTQVGLEVPHTPKQDKDKAEIPVEQAETITEETTVSDAQVGLEVPHTPKQDNDKTVIPVEQAETITEETTVPDTQVGLEVPLPAVEEKRKPIVVTEQPEPIAPETQNELKSILSASKNGQQIKFRDKEHEKNYNFILDMMPYSDIERKALAYLFALDTVCFEHIRDLYDFSDNRIMLSGLDKGWQTGTSKRTTRLAFNLYNSYCSDGETYIGSDGIEDSLPSACYSPAYLFCCEYAKYYVEALKIRFPEWF